MARYLVSFGVGDGERQFDTFADSLACYIDHQSDRGGSRVYNLAQCDAESTGLTESEQDAIDLADEMHTARVA